MPLLIKEHQLTDNSVLFQEFHLSNIARHRSNIARHPSYTTHHPVNITRHRAYITRHRANIARHRAYMTCHPSYTTHHRVNIIRHWSYITRHRANITRHRAYMTCHPSYTTRHRINIIRHRAKKRATRLSRSFQYHLGTPAFNRPLTSPTRPGNGSNSQENRALKGDPRTKKKSRLPGIPIFYFCLFFKLLPLSFTFFGNGSAYFSHFLFRQRKLLREVQHIGFRLHRYQMNMCMRHFQP